MEKTNRMMVPDMSTEHAHRHGLPIDSEREKTRVAMPCSFEEYKEHLEEELNQRGYNGFRVDNWRPFFWIIWDNDGKYGNYLQPMSIGNGNMVILTDFNKELFFEEIDKIANQTT